MPLHSFTLEPSSRDRIFQEEVLVTGQSTTVNLRQAIPSEAKSLTLITEGELFIIQNGQELSGKILLRDIPEQLILLARTYSNHQGDRRLTLEFETNRISQRYFLELTVVRICLDVDADRDGIVEYDNPAKKDWQWGKTGQGAIYLVNIDQDRDTSSDETDLQNRSIDSVLDFQDLTPLIIRKTGLAELPRHYDLWLSVNQGGRNKIRIFEDLDTSSGRELIGPGHNGEKLRWRDTQRDLILAIEGVHYPDRNFTGLVDIHLTLERDGQPYDEDFVRLRCAPWLMTPNTLAPQTVYIAQLDNNQTTIDDLRPVIGKANAQLDEVSFDLSEGDRWLQDEIEIGYSQSPNHLLSVCLESPRYRGLEDFPESLLGENFGHVTRGSIDERTRLDSFGNLEVSPPVMVNGKKYPLGRILYGDTHSSIPANAQRHFQPALRDFLVAQKVQAPIELFSDWLNVGHIDEFMTFVPAVNSHKGFKLLLASTNTCFQILEALQSQGDGNLQLRSGKRLSGKSAAITINEILDDQTFKRINQDFQRSIDFNERILKQELGLDKEDIIYLPMLFEGTNRRNPEVERADSFFPNMVNMIVLGSQLAIPKPFGPQLDNICQFEKAVRFQLEPLGLTCNFIDDWDTYFKDFGELHCGTNVKRQPFSFHWWQMNN